MKIIKKYCVSSVLRLKSTTCYVDSDFILTVTLRRAECRLKVKLPPIEFFVEGDHDKLKQVLINLISNACEAVEAGDPIEISLFSANGKPALVSIEVRNGGDPISPHILAQLTKPFFSTKSSGNGLGLAIVKRIIDAHQGSLTFTSTAEAGTQATVQLPSRMA